MEEYKALERSGDAIMENITQRNRTNKNGGDALKVVYKLCYWGRGLAEFVSDVAGIQSRQMNEFPCFTPKYPISAQFGYNFSRQTDSGAGIACFCHSLVTALEFVSDICF